MSYGRWVEILKSVSSGGMADVSGLTAVVGMSSGQYPRSRHTDGRRDGRATSTTRESQRTGLEGGGLDLSFRRFRFRPPVSLEHGRYS